MNRIAPTEAASVGPIGIFDSGVGGLTVVAAIRAILPHEELLYIGDTARVPYGGKSPETIQRYSLEIGRALVDRGAKVIVIACNTASALALERLRQEFSVPVLGVVAPGAEAAAKRTRNGRIGIVGTRATIRSGAYERSIRAHLPVAEVTSVACPLLVPLIEEGLVDDPILDAVLERCVGPLLATGIDTLVLGCTHYPLAKTAIARLAGPEVSLVDSGETCALGIADLLNKQGLGTAALGSGKLRIALTDPECSFLHIAAQELHLPVEPFEITLYESSIFPRAKAEKDG